MTAVLSSGVPSLMTHRPYNPMTEGMNDAWRRQYSHEQGSMNHWQQSQSMQMNSVQDMDFRLFQPESTHYENTIHSDGHIISPSLGYVPQPSWESDMDIGTPTSAGFPLNEPMEGYHPVRQNPAHHHLTLPPPNERVQSSTHSPRSPFGGMSPHQHYARPQDALYVKKERPNLTRSITAPAAPDQRPRRSTNVSGTPSIKRSGSEDEDEEYVPGEEVKPRGRKRQRIPHTAVERRYRENLNAHLDKLRQTVPSLASKRPAGGALKPGEIVGEGVKPSKCEILNGAIEHIGALGKENSALQMEVKALRSRLEDLERWCGAQGGFAK